MYGFVQLFCLPIYRKECNHPLILLLYVSYTGCPTNKSVSAILKQVVSPPENTKRIEEQNAVIAYFLFWDNMSGNYLDLWRLVLERWWSSHWLYDWYEKRDIIFILVLKNFIVLILLLLHVYSMYWSVFVYLWAILLIKFWRNKPKSGSLCLYALPAGQKCYLFPSNSSVRYMHYTHWFAYKQHNSQPCRRGCRIVGIPCDIAPFDQGMRSPNCRDFGVCHF